MFDGFLDKYGRMVLEDQINGYGIRGWSARRCYWNDAEFDAGSSGMSMAIRDGISTCRLPPQMSNSKPGDGSRRRFVATTMKSRGRKFCIGSGVVALAALFGVFVRDAVGGQVFEASPQWHDGKFRNPEPMVNDMWDALKRSFDKDPRGIPSKPLPVVRVDPSVFVAAPASGLRLTWLGHSSSILELDGFRFLLDPVWAKRSSPVSWAGPERWYDPPIAIDSLPALDAVLISHNHYDHLDRGAIEALESRKPRYVVPLGVGADLRDWGVDSARIVELDWWDSTMVGTVKIVSTPARHASGRGVFDHGKSLWMGFALHGPDHRVWYSGDTGPQAASKEIGRRLGPFDLTMVECGQYDRAWPDWHMTPAQSLAAHKDVGGRAMVPVHWGLFQLAFHSWDDPVERLLGANADGAETILVPRPGESIEPATYRSVEWWKGY